MRKAFNFYSSFDEVAQELNDKQFALFMRAVLDVQFLRKHIDEISFDDKILSITWKAVKHSVGKQLQGHCNKTKIDYNSLFHEVYPPSLARLRPANVQEEEEEKVQEVNKRASTIDNLSKEKKDELLSYMENYIAENGIAKVEIEKFTDYWKSATKNAIKKDWKAAFRNHCRTEWCTKVDIRTTSRGSGGVQC